MDAELLRPASQVRLHEKLNDSGWFKNSAQALSKTYG